jgi:hypothetical protein
MEPSKNFKKSCDTSSKSGAPLTILFVIPVKSVIDLGIKICGFIRVSYDSSILNPSVFTAAISVIRLPCEPPVVSISTIEKTNFKKYFQ